MKSARRGLGGKLRMSANGWQNGVLEVMWLAGLRACASVACSGPCGDIMMWVNRREEGCSEAGLIDEE